MYSYKLNRELLVGVTKNLMRFQKIKNESAKKTTRPYAFLIVSMAIMINSDKIILARFAPLIALERYSMLITFFGPITALINTTSTSKWFSFASSRLSGMLNLKIVMRTVIYIISAYLIFLLLSYLFFDNLKSLIWGNSVSTNLSLLCYFAIFSLASSLQSLFGIALTSVRGLRYQAKFMTMALPINLLFKIIMVHKFGAAGVIVINAIVFVLLLIIPSMYFLSHENISHEGDR